MLNALFAASGDSTNTCEAHHQHRVYNIQPRPEFFELSIRRMPRATELPQEWEQPGAHVDHNYFIESKLSVPISWSSPLKMAAQIRYKNERFNVAEIEDSYHDYVQFHNTSLTFLYKYELKNNWFVGGHYNVALKGDSFKDMSKALEYGGSVVVGQSCAHRKWGIGIALANSVGRLKISPLLMYNTELSPSWILDVRLPKEIVFKKAVHPDHFYWYNSVRGISATYALTSRPELGDNINYRRRSVDILTGVEREIKDWLWMNVEVGYNIPVKSVLVDRGDALRDSFHSFRTQPEPYFLLKIYAVVPRKFLNKTK